MVRHTFQDAQLGIAFWIVTPEFRASQTDIWYIEKSNNRCWWPLHEWNSRGIIASKFRCSRASWWKLEIKRWFEKKKNSVSWDGHNTIWGDLRALVSDVDSRSSGQIIWAFVQSSSWKKVTSRVSPGTQLNFGAVHLTPCMSLPNKGDTQEIHKEIAQRSWGHILALVKYWAKNKSAKTSGSLIALVFYLFFNSAICVSVWSRYGDPGVLLYRSQSPSSH